MKHFNKIFFTGSCETQSLSSFLRNNAFALQNFCPRLQKSCKVIYNKSMTSDFTLRQKRIEEVLQKALPLDFSRQWQDASFGPLADAISQNPTFIKKLIEPNSSLIALGGKRWRPLFLILCYEMAKEMNDQNKARALSPEAAYALTPLVEFVHTASLIHDDIEDNADLRRGKAAAHISYGLDTALNSASWLYFEAPVCLQSSQTAGLTDGQRLTFYKLYTNELRRLHLGQAMDIYWHRQKDIFPSLDEYQAMVRSKTGTLASLAAQVGFIAGGAAEEEAAEYGKIAAEIGVGFQIIDDVINLTKGNPGKKRGDDIVEGKKSLPVLIHIKDKPGDKEKICSLMEQAAREGIDSPAVEECIALLNTSSCIKQAAEKGRELISQNCAKFGSNQLITKLFNSMIPQEQ